MTGIIELVKDKFPGAEVFPSGVKDFVCVRKIVGQSNFGKNAQGEQVIVPIYDTRHYHVDTIRLHIQGLKSVITQ